MARKRMVTRSITATQVTALVIDVTVGEPSNITVILTGEFKDEKKLLKKIKESHETETLKVVHIVSRETFTKLYGMDEETFIENAKELDAETRKEVEYHV